MKDPVDTPVTAPDHAAGRPASPVQGKGRGGSVVPGRLRGRPLGEGWASAEGSLLPPGSAWVEEERAYNFTLHSRHAERVTLLLFGEADPARPLVTLDLDPRVHKTWDVWHCRLGEDGAQGARYYAYKVDYRVQARSVVVLVGRKALA
jgi:hypothetical protein